MNKYEVWGGLLLGHCGVTASSLFAIIFQAWNFPLSLSYLLSPISLCTSFSFSDLPFFTSSKKVTKSHVMSAIVLIPVFSCPISEKVQCRIFPGTGLEELSNLDLILLLFIHFDLNRSAFVILRGFRSLNCN